MSDLLLLGLRPAYHFLSLHSIIDLTSYDKFFFPFKTLIICELIYLKLISLSLSLFLKFIFYIFQQKEWKHYVKYLIYSLILFVFDFKYNSFFFKFMFKFISYKTYWVKIIGFTARFSLTWFWLEKWPICQIYSMLPSKFGQHNPHSSILFFPCTLNQDAT